MAPREADVEDAQESAALVAPAGRCASPAAAPATSLGLGLALAAQDLEAKEVTRRRSMRRGLFASLGLLAGASCAVTARQLASPGSSLHATHAADSFAMLMASVAEDAADMPDLSHQPDLLATWLSAASAAGSSAAEAPGSTMERATAADAAIRAALASGNPATARRIAEKLATKALKRAIQKRRELKTFIALSNKSLAEMTAEAQANLRKETKTAQCVFRLLSTTTEIARLASNINDVAETCGDFPPKKTQTQAELVRRKICVINGGGIAFGLSVIATNLAAAADVCSQTLVPNVDALCSASITGLLGVTSTFVGSFTLIAGACRPSGWYGKIPQGLVPSNVGNKEKMKALATPSAPPRKLLFGGGKGSLATQCATEIQALAWNLATFALAVNGASNQEVGGDCPADKIVNGTPITGEKRQMREAACLADAAGAATALFSAIVQAELIAVTCTDVLNLDAICASGISGAFGGATGVVATGAAMNIACDTLQKSKAMTKLQQTLAQAQEIQNLLAMEVPWGFSNVTGRRLLGEDTIAELEAEYGSPAGVWQSLGYDLDDPVAPWRQRADEPTSAAAGVNVADLVDAKEIEEAVHGGAGIFG